VEGGAAEELAWRELASAFTLQRADIEGGVATSDADEVGRGFQDSAGFTLVMGEVGLPDFKEDRVRGGGQVGKGAGPWGEGADAVVELGGGQSPIELAIGPGELSGVGSCRMILGLGNDVAVEIIGERLEEELGADAGEAIMELLSILVGLDGYGLGGEDIAGVEAGVDFHECDAGDGIAVEDGPLDGGSSAVFGEEGGVDIDAAVTG
jgi:hypothetical protein